jgi:hypothetical protein
MFPEEKPATSQIKLNCSDAELRARPGASEQVCNTSGLASRDSNTKQVFLSATSWFHTVTNVQALQKK